MIKLGLQDIKKIYLTDYLVKKVYIGTELIYPSVDADYIKIEPLTEERYTIRLNPAYGYIEYLDVNKSPDWSYLAAGESTRIITNGVVYLRGDWLGNQQDDSNYTTVTIQSDTTSVKISGDIKYLLSYENPDDIDYAASYCAAYHLFENSNGLVDASGLILSPEFVGDRGFAGMFQGCTRLEKPPVMKAIECDTSAFMNMFQGCTQLTEAPIINIVTAAPYCFNWMFDNCNSLQYVVMYTENVDAEYSTYGMFNGVQPNGIIYCNNNIIPQIEQLLPGWEIRDVQEL